MEAGAEKKEAGKQSGGEQDLSMEEILQSIRRIIAEDDSEGQKPVAAENVKPNGKKAADEDVPGSEVLELTEMLKDDGTVVNVKAEEKPTEEAKPATKETAPAGDVLSAIDEVLAPAKPAEKPAGKPIEKPAETAKPAEKPAEPIAEKPAAAPARDDALLSAEAAAAAGASLKKLQAAAPDMPVAAAPSPAFRSGDTVEGLVAEMLRPMMKAWLDANLPGIVERIVEREVRKLTRN